MSSYVRSCVAAPDFTEKPIHARPAKKGRRNTRTRNLFHRNFHRQRCCESCQCFYGVDDNVPLILLLGTALDATTIMLNWVLCSGGREEERNWCSTTPKMASATAARLPGKLGSMRAHWGCRKWRWKKKKNKWILTIPESASATATTGSVWCRLRANKGSGSGVNTACKMQRMSVWR
jgi:hypothetical protein